METSSLKVLLFLILYMNNICPLYSSAQNNGYITLEQYMKLMDEVQKINESKFNATNYQADLELKLSKVTNELRITKENYASFEFRTLQLEIENANSITELRNLKVEFENLTKSHEKCEMEIKHVEEKTNISTWIQFHIVEEKFDNVTKMYDTLLSSYHKLEKERISPVEIEIAVIKGLVKTQDNKITQNTKTAKELGLELSELQIANNASKENITSLLHRVIDEEKSAMLLHSNVSELSIKVSESKGELDRLHKLQNESLHKLSEFEEKTLEELKLNMTINSNAVLSACANNITYLEKRVNVSLENQEVQLESDIRSVRNDVSRLKGQSFLLRTVSAALHKLSLSTKVITQNMSRINADLNNEIHRQNTSLESVSRNIAYLSNNVKSLEFNHSETLTRLSALNQNCTILGNEIDTKVQLLQQNYTSSIENFKIMEKHNIDKYEKELAKFHISFQTLSGTLNSTRWDLNTFRGQNSKELDILTQNMSHFEVTLLDKIKVFKDECNKSCQATAKTDSEVRFNISILEHNLNRSLDNLEVEIRNLTVENEMLVQSQTVSLELMQSNLINNITHVKKELNDKVKTMNLQQNLSILHGLDDINNRLDTFIAEFTKTVHTFENEHEQNVSKRESEFQDMIKKVNEKYNTSIQGVNNTLHAVEIKLGRLERNFTQEISKISTQTGFNMSALELRLREALHKFVESENLRIQGFNRRMDQLNSKIDTMAHTTGMTAEHNSKVGLMACSTNRQFAKGSIIQFPDIKTMYGVQNNSTFNSTGKFQCEKPGLYIVSAQIMSPSKGAAYVIKVNDKELSRVHITPFHDDQSFHNYHTGTGLAVVQLERNDDVWIEVAETSMYVFGKESCINIVRIK